MNLLIGKLYDRMRINNNYKEYKMKAVTGEDLNLENDYNFLILCNNFIVDILKCADLNEWSSEKIDIKEKDKNRFDSQKYDLFYWRDHGYATVINKSLYKHIIFSLVADYNRYIFDAIDCATKYHFGPAFTLLRKPFKDNLLLIEMFYTKGHKFVADFLNKPIKEFAIDNISKEEKMKILKKCHRKLKFLTAKKMYDLRYSKNSKESLEKIWNKTLHIITNYKDYATENGNLNIVFATDDEVEEHIVYFYKVCCSMQLYVVQLLLNILRDENLISEELFNKNMSNLYFSFSCTLDGDIPNEIANSLVVKCSHCEHEFQITKEMIIDNNKNKTFIYKCNQCKKATIINGFLAN